MEAAFQTAFILSILLFGGIAIYALRSAKRARDAVKRLADAEGWTFWFGMAFEGRGAQTVLTHPEEGWSLTFNVHGGVPMNRRKKRSGAMGGRWTTFDKPDAAIDGLAILSAAPTAWWQRFVEALLGGIGGDMGRMLAYRIPGEFGGHLADLQRVDASGTGLLVATPGAETALDAVRAAPELIAALSRTQGAAQPIVLRGRFGLRVLVRRYLKSPDEIRELAALGRSLARALRAAEA